MSLPHSYLGVSLQFVVQSQVCIHLGRRQIAPIAIDGEKDLLGPIVDLGYKLSILTISTGPDHPASYDPILANTITEFFSSDYTK